MNAKREKREHRISLACQILMGLCVAVAIFPWVDTNWERPLLELEIMSLVIMYISLFFSLTISTIIHEIGHMICGLLSGYTFLSFRVFHFMLLRQDNRLVLKHYSLAGTAGQCLMKPPAWREGGIPYKLYNWGGVLANIAAFLLFLMCARSASAITLGGIFLRTMVVLNAYIVIVNSVPVLQNDGRNVRDISRSPAALRSYWQVLNITAHNSEGASLEDMPPELFQLPEDADLSNRMNTAIALTALDRELEKGEYEAVESGKRALVTDPSVAMSPIGRFLAQCDVIYLQLFLHGELDDLCAQFVSNKAHRKYRKSMANYPAVMRTAYAEAVVNGDEVKAQALIKRFEKVAEKYPYPTELKSERELMEAFSRRWAVRGDGAL